MPLPHHSALERSRNGTRVSHKALWMACAQRSPSARRRRTTRRAAFSLRLRSFLLLDETRSLTLPAPLFCALYAPITHSLLPISPPPALSAVRSLCPRAPALRLARLFPNASCGFRGTVGTDRVTDLAPHRETFDPTLELTTLSPLRTASRPGLIPLATTRTHHGRLAHRSQ